MRTDEVTRRSGIQIGPEATLAQAAELMEQAGVGALAVVDQGELVGIVTDRDLVRRGMARRVHYDARVDSVMSAPAVTIDAASDVHESYAIFRNHGVRRLAVVDEGGFIGMVSIDDLLINLAADLSDLSRPVIGEVVFGQRDSEVPAVS